MPFTCYEQQKSLRVSARRAHVDAAFDGHWDDEKKPHRFSTDLTVVRRGNRLPPDLPNWQSVKTIEEDPRHPLRLSVCTEFCLDLTSYVGVHWTAGAAGSVAVMVDSTRQSEKELKHPIVARCMAAGVTHF